MLFVDSGLHQPIDAEELAFYAAASGAVQVALFESAAELVDAALAWTDLLLSDATARLADRVLVRLREVEVSRATLEEWARVIAVVQAR